MDYLRLIGFGGFIKDGRFILCERIQELKEPLVADIEVEETIVTIVFSEMVEVYTVVGDQDHVLHIEGEMVLADRIQIGVGCSVLFSVPDWSYLLMVG